MPQGAGGSMTRHNGLVTPSSPRPKAGEPTVEAIDPEAPACSLERIMIEVGRGDRTAFESLYEECSDMVYGTSLRVLRDPDHAAEVAQEVMVEIWRSAPRFDPHAGSARGWIATIAHRRAVDRVRSVQSQRARDQGVADRSHEASWDVVAEEVERREEHASVVECLKSLSEVQRDAVQRTYYQGQTYRQAAEQADVALPTMKSRIRDALMGLRRCLEVAG